MGKFERLHQKTPGFSLVEMTVVLGLLAGAGVFIGNILVQGTKGQKKVSANLDFNIKMAEVLNVLQNSSYCNSTTNGVFRQASGATLNAAKLTNENTPATNNVNWIGYQVGSGGTAQNIKVLQEGDVLENTYTISEITFQRQKDTAGNVVAASSNAGKSTHPVELVITANPTSGSGFPITKSFKTTLITDTPATSPTNEVVGCALTGQGGGAGRISMTASRAPYTGTISRPTQDASSWSCINGVCGDVFSIHIKSADEICIENGYRYATGICHIAVHPGIYVGPLVGWLDANKTITWPQTYWSIVCRYNGGSAAPPNEITCVK